MTILFLFSFFSRQGGEDQVGNTTATYRQTGHLPPLLLRPLLLGEVGAKVISDTFNSLTSLSITLKDISFNLLRISNIVKYNYVSQSTFHIPFNTADNVIYRGLILLQVLWQLVIQSNILCTHWRFQVVVR